MRLVDDVLAPIAVIGTDIPAKYAYDFVGRKEDQNPDDLTVGIDAKVLDGGNDCLHPEAAKSSIGNGLSPAFEIARIGKWFFCGMYGHR